MRHGGLKTRDKILLHLLDAGDHQKSFEVPESVSETGIGLAVDVSRGTTGYMIKSMIEQGLIKRDKRNVTGGERKQWAYFLTEDGRSRALMIKNSLEESQADKKLLELSSIRRKSVKSKDLLKEYEAVLELVEKEKSGEEKYRLKLNILSEIVKLHLELRDIDQAMNTSLNILKLSLETNDKIREAQTRLYIGKIQEIRSEWQNAEVNFSRAYTLSDRLDDLLTAEAGRRLGRICWRMGKFNDAVFYYKKCLNRLRGVRNNKNGLISLYIDLGLVYGEMGDMDKAIEYYNKSLDISRRIGNNHETIRAWNNIGYAYQTMEKYSHAIEYYEKALESAIKADDREEIGHSLINAAYCYVKKGDVKKALEYTNSGLEIFELSNDLNMIGGVQRNCGVIYASKKQWKKAKKHFEKSIDTLEKINMPYHLAWTYFDYGLALKTKGDKKWKDLLKRALKIYEELKSVKDIEKVKRALKKKN